MKVNAGWYYVRKDLESVLDSLFQLAPEDFVEFDSLNRPGFRGGWLV